MKSKMEKKIINLVSKLKNKIELIDNGIIMSSIGVYQAIGYCIKSLKDIEKLLDKREYYNASQAGYGDITSDFIFLQRVLAEIQSSEQEKMFIVTEIAKVVNCSYEEVEPHVNNVMLSLKPKVKRTKAEMIKDKANIKKHMKQFKKRLDKL